MSPSPIHGETCRNWEVCFEGQKRARAKSARGSGHALRNERGKRVAVRNADRRSQYGTNKCALTILYSPVRNADRRSAYSEHRGTRGESNGIAHLSMARTSAR